MVKPRSNKIIWIGEPVQIQGRPVPNALNYYRKFKFGEVVAGVNDHVMILDPDAENLEQYDVAKILFLYQRDSKRHPFRAIVRRYIFPKKLPPVKRLTLSADIESIPDFDSRHEVVEDKRQSSDDDISIENIFSSCEVVNVEPGLSPQRVVDRYSDSRIPVYVCQYRLLRSGGTRMKFCLEPLYPTEGDSDDEEVIERKSIPSAVSVHEAVSPAKGSRYSENMENLKRIGSDQKKTPVRKKKLKSSDISALVNEDISSDDTDNLSDDILSTPKKGTPRKTCADRLLRSTEKASTKPVELTPKKTKTSVSVGNVSKDWSCIEPGKNIDESFSDMSDIRSSPRTRIKKTYDNGDWVLPNNSRKKAQSQTLESPVKTTETTKIIESSCKSQRVTPHKSKITEHSERDASPRQSISQKMKHMAIESPVKSKTVDSPEQIVSPRRHEKILSPQRCERISSPLRPRRIFSPQSSEKILFSQRSETFSPQRPENNLSVQKLDRISSPPQSCERIMSPKIHERISSPRRFKRILSPQRRERIISPQRSDASLSQQRCERILSPRRSQRISSPLKPVRMEDPHESRSGKSLSKLETTQSEHKSTRLDSFIKFMSSGLGRMDSAGTSESSTCQTTARRLNFSSISETDKYELPRTAKTVSMSHKESKLESLNLKQISESPTKRHRQNAHITNKEEALSPTKTISSNRKKRLSICEDINTYEILPEEADMPQPLLCRHEEFHKIFGFVFNKIAGYDSGCMYISGVPGTGKTATVEQVIKRLEACVERETLPPFKYVHVNGMKLSEPKRAYVKIWEGLTGKILSAAEAQTRLAKRFKSTPGKRQPAVLLVDEFDLLKTKRQEIIYNLFDWPTYKTSRLVVLAIANTMDLPEKSLMSKVASRLGLTRVSFQPYNHRQLQEIISAELQEECSDFEPDAVELISRKVASLSGDVRRAFDVCHRAVNLAKKEKSTMGMRHVEIVVENMMSNNKIRAIKSLSVMMKKFLQAVIAEMERTGNEQVLFIHVMEQLKTLCIMDGYKPLEQNQCMILFNCLTARGLIRRPKVFPVSIHIKLLLSVSVDDVHYALKAEKQDLVDKDSADDGSDDSGGGGDDDESSDN